LLLIKGFQAIAGAFATGQAAIGCKWGVSVHATSEDVSLLRQKPLHS